MVTVRKRRYGGTVDEDEGLKCKFWEKWSPSGKISSAPFRWAGMSPQLGIFPLGSQPKFEEPVIRFPWLITQILPSSKSYLHLKQLLIIFSWYFDGYFPFLVIIFWLLSDWTLDKIIKRALIPLMMLITSKVSGHRSNVSRKSQSSPARLRDK